MEAGQELVRFLVVAAAVQPLVAHLCLVALEVEIPLERPLVVVGDALLQETQMDLTVQLAEQSSLVGKEIKNDVLQLRILQCQ
jgi:hypothetical protein